MASADMGKPDVKPIHQILEIVEKLVQQATAYEEGVQSLQQGSPVNPQLFVGPQVVVLNAAPGLGKTRALVLAAEANWETLPLLHLGPTHDSFNNVDHKEGWGHWRGHDDGRKSGTPCPTEIRQGKGYSSGDECTCEATTPKYTGTPTFAPVDYILSRGPWDVLNQEELFLFPPLAQDALQYPWWAIDDVGLDRFVGKMEVVRQDLLDTAAQHPNEVVKILALALFDLLHDHTLLNNGESQPNQQNWYGLPLYDHLDVALQKHDSSIHHVLAGLANLGMSDEPWVPEKTEPKDWPLNFMPRVKSKLLAEMAAWVVTQTTGAEEFFQPHIHIVWGIPETGGKLQSFLRACWRRRPSVARPILLLDASGDLDLIQRAFRGFGVQVEASEPVDVPAFPTDMLVRHYWGAHVGKTVLKESLGKYRKLVVDEMSSRLAAWTGDVPPVVGLITFKDLVGDFQKALCEVGFDDDHQVTDYYYNVRGSNEFTSCDFVVLVGYPAANEQGLFEEACVLYFGDSEPISREPQGFRAHIELRNGRALELGKDIRGYADPRLHALYKQKSLSELYQAFHRARPYGTTQVKEVLVFSDVPVEGVPVDGFLGQEGKMLQVLTDLLEASDIVSKNQIVDVVQSRFPHAWNTTQALDKAVMRHSLWLHGAVGAWYIEGGSHNPGRFIRAVERSIKLEVDVSDSLLDAALAYAKAGIPVLPLHWPKEDGGCSCKKGANCTSNGKHPRTTIGVYDATTDEATIKQWWKKWPKANIGIRTGADSGLVVLDVDPRNGGADSLKELEAEHGPLPYTWKVDTGGGGWHFYFSYPTDVVNVKSQGHFADGVEIKSDGAYVVATPSLHAGDKLYAWVPSTLQEPPASMLPWLLGPAGKEEQLAGGGAPIEDLANIEADGVGKGQRDSAAMSLVGHWVALGTIDARTLIHRVLNWNTLNQPPMGEAEGDQDARQWAMEKVNSVLSREAQNHPERIQQRTMQLGADPD
jgi:hypothetical protein